MEESGTRRLKTKEDGAMGSQILQNPSDPDATYREKEGKQNRGYTANIVETVESMEKTEKPTVLITDGAYSGRDNTNAAAEKNIDLVRKPTQKLQLYQPDWTMQDIISKKQMWKLSTPWPVQPQDV